MTDFLFSLEARRFVGFLSAKIAVTGAGKCTVSATIAQEDLACSREVALDSASAQRFHALIVAALRTRGRHASWDQSGLDGTEYRGSLRSPALDVPEFRFWSPERNTPPHWLACAAFEGVRSSNVGDAFDSFLETMRSDLGLGTPLRWEPGDPPTLRVLHGWPIDMPLQFALAAAPANGDIRIDLRSNLRAVLLLPDLFPGLRRLAQRVPPPAWIVAEEWHARRLEAVGIPAHRIVIRPEDERHQAC